MTASAREALLECETASAAEAFVRKYIAERILVIGALLALPTLGLSLSRTLVGPWLPVHTIHVAVVALMWIAVALRKSLPSALVGAVFPLAVMVYACTETYLFGLATGGPVFAMFVPLLCIPVFGFRNALWIFVAVATTIAALGIRALVAPQHLGPNLLSEITSPDTWILAAAVAVILCFLGLFAFGTLMAALHLHTNANQSQARQIARDRERFELAMEGSNDGLWDWDIRTGEIYRTDRWFRMLGYRRGDFPDTLETFTRFLHPDDVALVQTADAALVAEAGRTIESEFRLRHRDGHWVPILSRAFIVREEGKPVRVVGTHIDLTERERLTADLRRIESMLSDGIEALPLGIAFFNRTDRLVLSNAKYAELMELETEDLRPTAHFESILRKHAAWAGDQCGFSTSDGFVQARLRSKDSAGRPWEYQQPSGRIIEIFEYPTSRGGFVSVVADVTEPRRRQAELHQAQKMDALGRLTGGVAHDFNNLLAVIRGNADILMFSAPEFSDEVTAIENAARRGSELTQRLLSFSRQQPLAPRPVSPRALIEDLAPILGRSLGEACHVTYRFDADVWDILVDPGLLENALLNLAINGRDSMPRGGTLEIAVTNFACPGGLPEAGISPGDYVRISVRDFGSGMSEATLARAFDPFFTTKEAGNGLGLAMVHGFALQSRGGVTIDTTLAVGTTVRLYLRRALTPARREAPAAPERGIAIGGGQSILVVEDDVSVRMMTARMLETLGYRVTTAEDAVSAERILLGDDSFDLVLSDIVLPGGKFGPEVIRDVRKVRSDFRVIFMSGYAPDVSDEFRALLEPNPLLRKPFGLQNLAAAVRDTLAADGWPAPPAGEAARTPDVPEA